MCRGVHPHLLPVAGHLDIALAGAYRRELGAGREEGSRREVWGEEWGRGSVGGGREGEGQPTASIVSHRGTRIDHKFTGRGGARKSSRRESLVWLWDNLAVTSSRG